MPTMTVLETCNYYATLTLPRKLNKATRQERIKEVLAAMGLSHTVNTLVRSSVVPHTLALAVHPTRWG